MSGRVLHVDLETRSCVDLRKTGAHKYAEDPTTTIVCGSYRFDDGPVRQWLGTEIPGEVAEHLAVGGKMAGHNQQFERVVLNEWLPCLIEPEQQDCTMARGLAVGLPASLEQMGEALGASVQKDKDGHRLMMQMCKPRGFDAAGTPLWWDDADRLQRLSAYCDQDVAAECAIDALVPRLSERERRVWELDQRVNARGFQVDLPLVRKALTAVDAASKAADREMWRLTNGAVKRCTEVAKIVAWVQGQGVPCKSVAKGEIDDLIVGAEMFDKPVVADVVRLRRATARSSTAKFKAMLDSVCRDGRIRGTLNYHRAHTGRWGGSGVQPQNFPRVDDPEAVGRALDALKTYDQPVEIVTAIDVMCGPPIEVLSKCLRAMIVAAPGYELLGGDFSNIEGRINAWLNGETWKLDAFRAYDAGTGPDLYYVMAADVTGKRIEDVTKVERQVSGKVPELACGFQGAVGAFLKMAYTQDPPVRVTEAEAKRIVSAWREKNYHIVQGWWEIQDAAIEAVGAPGCVVYCRGNKVAYTVSNGFLWCLLPSGRVIAYAKPRLVWKEIEAPTEGEWANGMAGEGPIYIPPTEGRYKRVVEYMGVDSLTKRWSVQSLYGGSQMNHVVQGTARDRMVEAMFAVEDAGLPLVLTVHDELLSEVPVGTASAEQYADLMMREPDWAAGLPVAVKTWKDVRYVK
jgi:DNA polymerase